MDTMDIDRPHTVGLIFAHLSSDKVVDNAFTHRMAETSTLMRIPPDIRLEIYSYLVETEQEYERTNFPDHNGRSGLRLDKLKAPALCQVNQQLRTEYFPFFFANTKFIVRSRYYEPRPTTPDFVESPYVSDNAWIPAVFARIETANPFKDITEQNKPFSLPKWLVGLPRHDLRLRHVDFIPFFNNVPIGITVTLDYNSREQYYTIRASVHEDYSGHGNADAGFNAALFPYVTMCTLRNRCRERGAECLDLNLVREFERVGCKRFTRCETETAHQLREWTFSAPEWQELAYECNDWLLIEGFGQGCDAVRRVDVKQRCEACSGDGKYGCCEDCRDWEMVPKPVLEAREL